MSETATQAAVQWELAKLGLYSCLHNAIIRCPYCLKQAVYIQKMKISAVLFFRHDGRITVKVFLRANGELRFGARSTTSPFGLILKLLTLV